MKDELKILVSCCLLLTVCVVTAYAQTSDLLRYHITCPDTVRIGDTLVLELMIDVEEPWYAYAPGGNNEAQGMQSIRLQFDERSSAIRPIGAMEYSAPLPHGAYTVYIEDGNILTQRFIVPVGAPLGDIELSGQLHYQICNAEVCYPPMSETFFVDVHVLDVNPIHARGSADALFEDLENAKKLCSSEEEHQRYKSLPPLAMKQFEDQRMLNRAILAKEFWANYPTDPRRDQALVMFLSADPWFISATGNASLENVKTWKGLDSKGFMRAIVIDTIARNRWLQEGNQMLELKLQHPDSSDVAKEWIAFAQFARDFRLAARHFGLQENLADEAGYWQPFFKRFVAHIEAYAEQPNLPARATDFLAALKGRSPAVAASYWQALLHLPVSQNDDRVGVQALRQTAREQLLALGVSQGTAPLAMAFTALDGRDVDLNRLRGKVVLIDFWATWCKPCLDELPRLKALYAQYQAQGFEIVGICLDDVSVRNRVEEVLKDQGITWAQRFEGKGFSSDTYRLLYGINSLPTVWLLDKQGIIVDSNARGEKLEPMIRKYLGQPLYPTLSQ